MLGFSFFVVALTGTYNLSGTDIIFPTDFGATKDMGTSHSYRYIQLPAKPAIVETLLYENTDPTGDFGDQNVTLNYEYTNFDLIKIIVRQSKTVDTRQTFIYPKETLSYHGTSGANTKREAAGVMYRPVTSWNFIRWRTITIVDTTTIRFSTCWSSDNSSRKTEVIPIFIYGINL